MNTPWYFTSCQAATGFKPSCRAAAVSEPQLLVGAKVRLRGTAATSFNAQLRQLITMIMFVPFPSDFIVEKTVPGDPFEAPVLPAEQPRAIPKRS